MGFIRWTNWGKKGCFGIICAGCQLTNQLTEQFQVGADISARSLEEQLLEVQAMERDNASHLKVMKYI